MNSGVVGLKDGFGGVLGWEKGGVEMNMFGGLSKEGMKWEMNDEGIVFKGGNREMID